VKEIYSVIEKAKKDTGGGLDLEERVKEVMAGNLVGLTKLLKEIRKGRFQPSKAQSIIAFLYNLIKTQAGKQEKGERKRDNILLCVRTLVHLANKVQGLREGIIQVSLPLLEEKEVLQVARKEIVQLLKKHSALLPKFWLGQDFQYVTEGGKEVIREVARSGLGGEGWEHILTKLKIQDIPLRMVSGNTCTITLQQPQREEQRISSVFFWNANGFRARWNSHVISFKDTVKGKSPSLIIIAESRTDGERMWKLRGFEEWLYQEGYVYSCVYWTGNGEEEGTKFGEGGVAFFSKVKPQEVMFGLGKEEYDTQARVVTVVFPQLVVIGTYNPQGGFEQKGLDFKTAWERALGHFLRKMRRERATLPILWVGDLNVNPLPSDWSEEVWVHLRHKLGNQVPAGCRKVDIDVYRENIQEIDGVNLGEYFCPEGPKKTHFANDELRARGVGQRIDHMIASQSLLHHTSPVQITDFQTLQELGGFEGGSDHCPLFCKVTYSDTAQDVHLLKEEEHNKFEDFEITSLNTGEKHVSLFRKQPVCQILIDGRAFACLLDTGSGHTIFNPRKGETDQTDPVFGRMPKLKEEKVVVKGNCGLMESAKTVSFRLGWSHTDQVWSSAIVLKEHVEGFPTVILGRTTLVGDCGGLEMRMRDDEVVVSLGKWPTVERVCSSLKNKQHDFDIFWTTEARRVAEEMAGVFVKQHEKGKAQGGGKGVSEEFEKADLDEIMWNEETVQEAPEKQNAFEDAPNAIVMANIKTDQKHVSGFEILIDSGSEINLISETAAVGFTKSQKQCKETEKWKIRTANGTRSKIEKYIDLELDFRKGWTRPVRFFILRDLPVQAIIGNQTLIAWDAELSWAQQKLVVKEKGKAPYDVPWKWKKEQYWRYPVVVRADRDYEIAPGSVQVVGVGEIEQEELRGRVGGEMLLTPVRTKERLAQKFLVGYGYGPMERKVLVFNPEAKPVKVRKGAGLAEVHFSNGRFELRREGQIANGKGEGGEGQSANGKGEGGEGQSANGKGGPKYQRKG
jgi:exodeoxyribonuclease-3